MLDNFNELLSKYAQLIIQKGVNVQAGDYVQISADLEQAPLTRLMTEAAYKAGAKQVVVFWSDDAITRTHYTYQDTETLVDIPQYKVDEAHDLLNKRAKRIALRSSNPNALNGIDPDKISSANLANAKAMQEIRLATQANQVSWLVVAGAGQAWAELVFPDLAPEAALDALWEHIFKACRVDQADPIQAWDEHEATLQAKADYLNKQQFAQLHYTAPGTDFTLGLPDNHVWESAGSVNQQGESFIANMPTEEVFTAPDFRQASGVVSSTKPLSYGGTVIDGMVFHFEDGQIVQASAKEGEETLHRLIENNKGAKALGEVALVPHASPISQSGIIFYNTLFDENASNHLAIGQAYATSVKGGTEMSQEELEAAGLNRSTVHVDFMIGSAEMDIDGITQDGQRIPIFRQGAWVI